MNKRKFTILIYAVFFISAEGITQDRQMQFWRPYNLDGLNIYEPPKADTVPYEGIKVRIGGAFTQQYQGLEHSNDPNPVTEENTLKEIGGGFNLATANLNIDVQLADGVRMNVITYLSSRHHPEAWVKGGYIQFDKLNFLNSEMIDNIMDYVTLRIGHMEINYGDMHFRRSDNGNTFFNPFVGNFLMDAFTTEIGAEVYFQRMGWLAMAGVTGGEIQGGVTNPGDRSPSFFGKVGYDTQVNDNVRIRITGSLYTTSSSVNNTLYAGDRAGARYYSVMDAVDQEDFRSGRINPGLNDNVTAWVINPFVKIGSLEIFGNIESASGSGRGETDDRTWYQYAGEVLYRFPASERAYVGLRYNVADGQLRGSLQNVTVNRFNIGGGWYVLRNLLVKAEYVNQQYNDYPAESINHEGQFNGFVIEAAVAF
jgi:hypothetical protein